MSEVIVKTIKVIEAKYVEEADSIILMGECEEGQIRHQINSNCFYFGNKDKSVEMRKTAELMINKVINIEFNEDAKNISSFPDSYI
jgi:predicted phosphodiesterase